MSTNPASSLEPSLRPEEPRASRRDRPALSAEPPGSSPWWRKAVVYQIYPRSFSDGNGDGVGDLAGVRSRLDYLERLGVDVLWLSPIYPSPQDDNGYDISDYQDIDPTFGTLEEFDALLEDVHRRGLKLVMDLVVNHTSDEHPWFVESRSSTDNSKRDWYWWRPPAVPADATGTPTPPTNWTSAFSGPAWELDERTGEYYLHLFSRKQPDLNWENPEVRAAVHAMMRWWLDRGVDGFRMDVINFISKRLPLSDGGAEQYTSGPRIHEFLAEMRAEVFAGREGQFLTVGEMPGVTVEDARLFTDPDRREVDMVFQFEHVSLDHVGSKWDHKPLDLRDLKTSLGRWQEGLAEAGWNSLYWNNHDQPRVVSRFGDDGEHRVRSAKALGIVLHLHRGTPYIYQGEEIGMTNMPEPQRDSLRDIESINHYEEAVATGADPVKVLASLWAMSRDNARTPMQWDASERAGFTSGTPWIDVNVNHVDVNVEAALADPDSVFHTYRRLIELRHELPVVSVGDFRMLLPEDAQVYAFTRTLADERVLVVANLSAQDATVDPAALGEPGEWDECLTLIENLPRTQAPAESVAPWRLAPWEARALLRKD